MKPAPIIVYEHTSLKVGERGFKQEHFDALVKYNQQNQFKFFEVGHQRIRFTEQVGVLQVGNLTIEVLPKIDKSKEQDAGLCQNVLLRMLQSAGYMPVNASMPSGLHIRHSNLLELYLRAFLDETEALTHQGLVKRYRLEESNQKALKGSLQFSHHLSRNLIHKERFYTRHQVYDLQHRLNLILKQAVAVLPMLTRSAETVSRAKNLLLQFPEEGHVQIEESLFNRITFDRKTERYRKAIELAKLILLRLNPDIKSGSTQVVAFLFDMNLLFERYIARSIRVAARDYLDLEVSTQERQGFWKSQYLQPDVVIRHGNRTYIIDTKWKSFTSGRPDIADLRQIYAYNHHWKAESGTLLYPRKGEEAEVKDNNQYHLPYPSLPGEAPKQHSCYVRFCALTARGTLNKEIGHEILKAVLEVQRLISTMEE